MLGGGTNHSIPKDNSSRLQNHSASSPETLEYGFYPSSKISPLENTVPIQIKSIGTCSSSSSSSVYYRMDNLFKFKGIPSLDSLIIENGHSGGGDLAICHPTALLFLKKNVHDGNYAISAVIEFGSSSSPTSHSQPLSSLSVPVASINFPIFFSFSPAWASDSSDFFGICQDDKFTLHFMKAENGGVWSSDSIRVLKSQPMPRGERVRKALWSKGKLFLWFNGRAESMLLVAFSPETGDNAINDSGALKITAQMLNFKVNNCITGNLPEDVSLIEDPKNGCIVLIAYQRGVNIWKVESDASLHCTTKFVDFLHLPNDQLHLINLFVCNNFLVLHCASESESAIYVWSCQELLPICSKYFETNLRQVLPCDLNSIVLVSPGNWVKRLTLPFLEVTWEFKEAGGAFSCIQQEYPTLSCTSALFAQRLSNDEYLIQSVLESQPIHRYLQLVQANQFAEAEELAATFKLVLDSDYLIKAKLLETLVPQIPHLTDDEQFKQLVLDPIRSSCCSDSDFFKEFLLARCTSSTFESRPDRPLAILNCYYEHNASASESILMVLKLELDLLILFNNDNADKFDWDAFKTLEPFTLIEQCIFELLTGRRRKFGVVERFLALVQELVVWVGKKDIKDLFNSVRLILQAALTEGRDINWFCFNEFMEGTLVMCSSEFLFQHDLNNWMLEVAQVIEGTFKKPEAALALIQSFVDEVEERENGNSLLLQHGSFKLKESESRILVTRLLKELTALNVLLKSPFNCSSLSLETIRQVKEPEGLFTLGLEVYLSNLFQDNNAGINEERMTAELVSFSLEQLYPVINGYFCADVKTTGNGERLFIKCLNIWINDRINEGKVVGPDSSASLARECFFLTEPNWLRIVRILSTSKVLSLDGKVQMIKNLLRNAIALAPVPNGICDIVNAVMTELEQGGSGNDTGCCYDEEEKEEISLLLQMLDLKNVLLTSKHYQGVFSSELEFSSGFLLFGGGKQQIISVLYRMISCAFVSSSSSLADDSVLQSILEDCAKVCRLFPSLVNMKFVCIEYLRKACRSMHFGQIVKVFIPWVIYNSSGVTAKSQMMMPISSSSNNAADLLYSALREIVIWLLFLLENLESKANNNGEANESTNQREYYWIFASLLAMNRLIMLEYDDDQEEVMAGESEPQFLFERSVKRWIYRDGSSEDFLALERRHPLLTRAILNSPHRKRIIIPSSSTSINSNTTSYSSNSVLLTRGAFGFPNHQEFTRSVRQICELALEFGIFVTGPTLQSETYREYLILDVIKSSKANDKNNGSKFCESLIDKLSRLLRVQKAQIYFLLVQEEIERLMGIALGPINELIRLSRLTCENLFLNATTSTGDEIPFQLADRLFKFLMARYFSFKGKNPSTMAKNIVPSTSMEDPAGFVAECKLVVSKVLALCLQKCPSCRQNDNFSICEKIEIINFLAALYEACLSPSFVFTTSGEHNGLPVSKFIIYRDVNGLMLEARSLTVDYVIPFLVKIQQQESGSGSGAGGGKKKRVAEDPFKLITFLVNQGHYLLALKAFSILKSSSTSSVASSFGDNNVLKEAECNLLESFLTHLLNEGSSSGGSLDRIDIGLCVMVMRIIYKLMSNNGCDDEGRPLALINWLENVIWNLESQVKASLEQLKRIYSKTSTTIDPSMSVTIARRLFELNVIGVEFCKTIIQLNNSNSNNNGSVKKPCSRELEDFYIRLTEWQSDFSIAKQKFYWTWQLLLQGIDFNPFKFSTISNNSNKVNNSVDYLKVILARLMRKSILHLSSNDSSSFGYKDDKQDLISFALLYVNDFDIPEDYVYLEYIRETFKLIGGGGVDDDEKANASNSNSSYSRNNNVEVSTFSTSFINNNSLEMYSIYHQALERVKSIFIPLIANREMLLILLADRILSSISPYQYEIIGDCLDCIKTALSNYNSSIDDDELTMTRGIDAATATTTNTSPIVRGVTRALRKSRKILQLISGYVRRCPVSEGELLLLEKENFNAQLPAMNKSSQSNSAPAPAPAPALEMYRLPFQLFLATATSKSDSTTSSTSSNSSWWKILAPELTSYRALCQLSMLAEPLGQDPDYFILVTIENIITSTSSASSASSNASVKMRGKEGGESLLLLLDQIKGTRNGIKACQYCVEMIKKQIVDLEQQSSTFVESVPLMILLLEKLVTFMAEQLIQRYGSEEFKGQVLSIWQTEIKLMKLLCCPAKDGGIPFVPSTHHQNQVTCKDILSKTSASTKDGGGDLHYSLWIRLAVNSNNLLVINDQFNEIIEKLTKFYEIVGLANSGNNSELLLRNQVQSNPSIWLRSDGKSFTRKLLYLPSEWEEAGDEGFKDGVKSLSHLSIFFIGLEEIIMLSRSDGSVGAASIRSEDLIYRACKFLLKIVYGADSRILEDSLLRVIAASALLFSIPDYYYQIMSDDSRTTGTILSYQDWLEASFKHPTLYAELSKRYHQLWLEYDFTCASSLYFPRNSSGSGAFNGGNSGSFNGGNSGGVGSVIPVSLLNAMQQPTVNNVKVNSGYDDDDLSIDVFGDKVFARGLFKSSSSSTSASSSCWNQCLPLLLTLLKKSSVVTSSSSNASYNSSSSSCEGAVLECVYNLKLARRLISLFYFASDSNCVELNKWSNCVIKDMILTRLESLTPTKNNNSNNSLLSPCIGMFLSVIYRLLKDATSTIDKTDNMAKLELDALRCLSNFICRLTVDTCTNLLFPANESLFELIFKLQQIQKEEEEELKSGPAIILVTSIDSTLNLLSNTTSNNNNNGQQMVEQFLVDSLINLTLAIEGRKGKRSTRKSFRRLLYQLFNIVMMTTSSTASSSNSNTRYDDAFWYMMVVDRLQVIGNVNGGVEGVEKLLFKLFKEYQSIQQAT